MEEKICSYEKVITYGCPFGTVKIGFLESKIRKITSDIAENIVK